MRNRLRIFCLSALLGCSLAACGGSEDHPPQDSAKPILDAGATDEELLDLVKEDINVVAPEDFARTVRELRENRKEYSGQLYQVEGFYTKKDETPYITDTLEGEAGERLPLRYLTEEPEEGVRVKVTGVIGEEHSEDGTDASLTLEVVVLELLEE